jgi:NADH-quinone oxidoreductase subunit J
MIDAVFIVLSFIAIAGGLGMILFAQPIYSALSLIVSIISLAGVFALLSAPFLFMVQIIIYAGAIITLLVFIVMFLNIKDENLPVEPNKVNVIFVGAALLLPFNILILKAFNTLPEKSMHILSNDFGGIKNFGNELFRGWLVPFELISMLLLASLVGAIVYARKDKVDV